MASDAEATVEVVGERTETTKTFETDVSGVMVTEVYAEPVHFEDRDTGAMVEIDPTLETTTDGDLETVAAPVTVEIAADATEESMVTVDLGDGMTASFGVEDTLSVPAEVSAAGDLVTFDGLVEDASLVLEPTGSGVKETIILDSPDAPTVWRFPLDLDGLVATVDPEYGHVLLHSAGDPDGEPVGMVPHGWMIDAAFGTNPDEVASYSEGVVYTLEDTADGPVLVVTIDESWLGDPARVWPVTVDPTLVQIDASADDTWVTPYVTTDRSTLGYMYAGSLGMFVNQAYLHLDTASVAGKVIHFAEFKALQTNGATCDATNVDLYRVTSAWAGLNLRWTNQPTVAATPSTTTFTTQNATGGSGCTDAEWATWGVSGLVRNWADGTWANHGISLRAPAGQTLNPDFWKKFGSANATWKPHLHVVWSETGATGAPDTPTDLQPDGVVADPYAPLAATFTDPQGDTGKVGFEVYDNTTNQLLGIFEGSTVASGGTSTFTPTVAFDYDRPYRIQAHAIDTAGNWSQEFAATTATVSSVTLTPAGDTTVFHDQVVEATSAGGYTINEVVFRVDDQDIATDSNGTNGWTTVWDTTEATDGGHTIQAVVHIDGGYYLSPPVQVTVANALPQEDRIEIDHAQGVLDLDGYVLTKLRSLAGSPLLPDRYGDVASSSDHGSTGAQMVLIGEHWGDMTNAGRQAVREATYLRGDGVEPGDPSPGDGHPHPDPDGSGLASCSASNRVHGSFTGDREGWWCMAEYSYATDYGGSVAHVPDLRFFFTVGTRPDDVPATDIGGVSGGSSNDIPDRIDDVAEQMFVAFEEYGRMGFHWDGWYDANPLAVGVWDVDRSSVSFFDDDTGDLAGLHPITLDNDAFEATARHEAFHVVEYDYVAEADLSGDEPITAFHYGRTSTAWFVEASAEWAASEVAKRRDLADADDPPSSAIAHFLSDPSARLTDIDNETREYGAVAFLEYLEEHVGPSIVRLVWQDIDDEETAEDPDEAIDFIESRADAASEPLGDLLPDFWAAAYLLTNSNIDTPATQILDENLVSWRQQLQNHGPPTAGDATIPEARAARHALDLSDSTPEASLDEPVTVQAGGATFIDVVPDGVVGDVDVHIDGQYGGDTAVVVLPYGPLGFPYLCTTAMDPSSDGYRVHPTDAGGGWEGTVTVTPTCPTFSIALVHTAPQLYDSTQLGDPDEVFTHVGVEVVDPQPLDPVDWDLDASFAGDGKLELPDGFIPEVVLADPAGRLVLARTHDGALEAIRYLPDGRTDASFGTDGLATHDLPTSTPFLAAMEPHDSGYAFLTEGESGGEIQVSIGRVREDGSLDPALGLDGIATHSSPGNHIGLDGAVSGDAMFISATAFIGGDNVGPLIGKVSLTGTSAGEMDAAFSGDGWTHVIQNPDGTTDAFGGVEVVGTRALVATYDYDTHQAIITAFNVNTGAVDTAYGTAGSTAMNGFAAAAAGTQGLHAHISHVLLSDRHRSTRITSTGTVDTAWGASGTLLWPATGPVVDTFLDHTYASIDDVDEIRIHAYTDTGSLDADYWGDGIAVIDTYQGVHGITEAPSDLGGYGVVVVTGSHIYRLLPGTP